MLNSPCTARRSSRECRGIETECPADTPLHPAQNLVDARVAQRSLQRPTSLRSGSPASLPLSAWIASSAFCKAVDREPHRMRKLLVQQQKLQDSLRRQIRRVHLAVRLKRRRRAQQPHPVQVFIPFGTRSGMLPQIPWYASSSIAVADARSMYRPTWMNCQPSPWLIVESVTPWNWCTASITCCRNSVGWSGSTPSSASACMSTASRAASPADTGCSSRCHCSVEICSRTCREFSRAEIMQERIEALFPVSKVNACVSAYGSPVHSTSFWIAQRLQHPLPAPLRARLRSHPASGSDSHRAAASCAPPAPDSGSSSTDCRQRVIASALHSLRCRLLAQHPRIFTAAALR